VCRAHSVAVALLAAVGCALLFPIAVVVPALVALALVAAVWVAFDAYEIIWWREAARAPRAGVRLLNGGSPSRSRTTRHVPWCKFSAQGPSLENETAGKTA
jgi:hypothetical protein